MATTTFAAALLIFTNLWLIALVSFGVIASSLFLYILGSVGAIVGPSLAISLISVGADSQRNEGIQINKYSVSMFVPLPHSSVYQRSSHDTSPLAPILAELDLRSPPPCSDSPMDNCDNCRSSSCLSRTTLSQWCDRSRCGSMASRNWLLDLQSSCVARRGHAVSAYVQLSLKSQRSSSHTRILLTSDTASSLLLSSVF